MTSFRRSWLRFTVTVVMASLLTGCGADSVVQGPFVGSEATVRAINIAFEPADVSLPSGTPLRIVLDNQGAGVPHNIKIVQGGREIGKSPIITGPGQTEVRFGPLTPGTYQFVCEVHPNMTGTLTVTP
jgi:plastocyanin